MHPLKALLTSLLLLISMLSFGQVTPSADASGYLEYTGTISTHGKGNFEVSSCIASSPLIMGVMFKTEFEEDATDSSFVKGANADDYYVDNYESPAGQVKYKFQYLIKKGQLSYRFYDIEHEQSDSEFKSIGFLPAQWNETVGTIFTKKQYSEILVDLKMNVANAIRMVDKYCLK